MMNGEYNLHIHNFCTWYQRMKTLHGKKQESIDRSLEFSKLGKAFYVPNVLMALMNRPIIKVEVFSGFEPAVSQP